MQKLRYICNPHPEIYTGKFLLYPAEQSLRKSKLSKRTPSGYWFYHIFPFKFFFSKIKCVKSCQKKWSSLHH